LVLLTTFTYKGFSLVNVFSRGGVSFLITGVSKI
jgi:hypothetical protein